MHLTFRVDRDEDAQEFLEVDVFDQGRGSIRRRSRPRSTAKTFSGRQKRGWGLQIIRSLMDSVVITSDEEGTRILMRKYK